MERKIYYNLAAIATITAIITSIVLVFLFYEYYNPKDIIDNININTYDINNLPQEKELSYYDLKIDDKVVRISKPIEDIKHTFIGILPAMAGLLVFILIFLYIISSILTSKIIKPIEIASYNIESILSGGDVEDSIVYEELQPFIRTMEIQKKQIENYIESLKKTEKIRREFTANVSHELKTPLTSINGFAEMIETGMANDDDIKRAASIIQKEGKRLLSLIDSIIKLSQLDDLSINREFSSIDLLSITQFVCSNLEINAREKNISLNITGKSTIIKGNQRMIEDLIFNLVDNAIKYNKLNGKVDLEIHSIDSWGILKVMDTGIGIPSEKQDRVFERFYRVDKSRSKKVNGTGLGLSIVKHTVEHHGGKVSLSSIEGKGTTIEVKLPKANY
ncbi:two-component system, OmpR family, phosphate regulon sensor histidine kinase PhoR [Tissierella praeacuta DSM 18095]|uniref:histidine kinase n=1 Tax=Tissierella praeacuta DSM 18095 TaxID=1123404 RepID=A0A1M4Y490_9FIRM|nr:ATP-binding protein [Tissierella praeacuta]SHF00571.1 two-component system, OmpR family, phosphate regulon sensor histidine kinase PhoR [Tissierella praeacuta DSM 18095]SUO98862.1 Alkaline phosphatase synthesis sensor protein phoR [Tissierella praeacuta]